MKIIWKYTFFVFIVVIFCSGKSSTEFCPIFEKIKFTKISGFSPDIKFGYEEKESILLNKKQYEELFGEEMNAVDSCSLFGKFKISNNRIGVYMHRSTNECDQRINLIELLIVESCKKVESKTLMFEDHHGFIYEISSKFNKEFSLLTVTETSSSEYAMEPGVTTDTLFTKTYGIDLKSKNLDTIYRKSKFKVLKAPLQK